MKTKHRKTKTASRTTTHRRPAAKPLATPRPVDEPVDRQEAPIPNPLFIEGDPSTPESTPTPGANPLNVHSPNDQEGQGDRQNDELAELEKIVPTLNREKKGNPEP